MGWTRGKSGGNSGKRSFREKKADFYIAQYPVRRTAQNALHVTTWPGKHAATLYTARILFIYISTELCLCIGEEFVERWNHGRRYVSQDQ